MGMMDNGGLNGDILFGGNMNGWRVMANTIKMRIALRMADVDSSTASSVFNSAYNSGVISSGGDLHYPYLTSDAVDNPWQDRFHTRYDFVVSEKFGSKGHSVPTRPKRLCCGCPPSGGPYSG